MMDALEKVEKELKKPLMRNDKKGMAVLLAEFDKINQKYVLFHKLIRLSNLILTLLCMHLSILVFNLLNVLMVVSNFVCAYVYV